MNKPTENKVVTELNITAQEQTAITATFEQHVHECPETKEEYWTARELMVLLGYTNWRKFYIAIERAMEICQGTGDVTSDHFDPRVKMVSIGSGSKRETQDFHLSRYACYLIAQNGDTRKPVIRLAKRFFAVKTWEMQKVDAARTDGDRTTVRRLVKRSERDLAAVIDDLGGKSTDQSTIRSMGDEALFTLPTADIKLRLGIKDDADLTPLSDVLAVELLDARLEINLRTVERYKLEGIKDLLALEKCHIENATVARKRLISRNLTPGQMEPMLLIGSVTGTMKTNASVADSKAASYKHYIASDNITGYAGVEKVDDGYIGRVSSSLQTSPQETKQLAMQAATSMSVLHQVDNPGSLLQLYNMTVIPAILSTHKLTLTKDLTYLLCGYLTRIINDLDHSHISDLLEVQGLPVEQMRSEILIAVKQFKIPGYAVVENSNWTGIFISLYI